MVDLLTDKKILVFSPHSDDVSIGSGGFLSELARENTIIPLLAYTGWRGVETVSSKAKATRIREDEMRRESRALGIKPPVFLRLSTYERDTLATQTRDVAVLKRVIQKEAPDIIFLPNRHDLHPRHRLLTRLLLTALKELRYSVTLLYYEIPWSAFSGHEFNFIVPLSARAVKKKLAGIKVHTSQLARTDFIRMSKALLALRAGMVPEQKIGGYGSSVNLGKWLEVYKYQEFKA